eukprot:12283060-Alexandrium_andersonii.AAC.1
MSQWAAVQATHARFMVAAARMTALGHKRWGRQGDGARPAEHARAAERGPALPGGARDAAVEGARAA